LRQIEKLAPGPSMEQKIPIKNENKNTGVVEYDDGSFGWRNPHNDKVFSGLTRVGAASFAAYMLANQKGRAEGAPTPGSAKETLYQIGASAGPPIETIFKAFTGPTTLSEVADNYGLSYSDVQQYKAIQESTSLSAEQQTFVNSEKYKLLTKADEQAKRNQKQSEYISELAEEYRKRFPINRKHIAGATAAFREIAKNHGGGMKGMLEAVINAFKHDKLTMASQGWDSVGYTIALTMGNIPVQLGMFAALAVGTSQKAIEEWKENHKGKEPPPEVIQDIKILSALRIAVEKASAGLLTKYLSQLPLGAGGPAAWARNVQTEILQTINPTVRSLSTLTGKYVAVPLVKTGKAMAFEGFQESVDSILEEWALIDPATVQEGERWKIEVGKAGLGFVHGAFGIFTTGAGVKAVDLATRTVVGIGKVITSESAATQVNRINAQKIADKIALFTDRLQRIENYKKTDPKVIKEFEIIVEEVRELEATAEAAQGAEIGANGELVTDSDYIKHNFLAYKLQIDQGSITPEAALEEIFSNMDAELVSKMETRENLASQIPKTLTFGETRAGKPDVATYEATLASIALLEQETELSEEQEAKLSELRKEEQRLSNKLEQPANPEIAAIEEAGLKPVLEELIKIRDTKSYEINWRGRQKYPVQPDVKKEKPDNTITDEKLNETLRKVDGAIGLKMEAPVGEMEGIPPDLNYAHIDPTGKWRVGDLVTIKDSKDPKIQESQGFAIEYILAEQIRDGKVHVKLKGLSETVPIDQLEEVGEQRFN